MVTVEGLMGHVNWTQKPSESLLAEYTGVDHRSDRLKISPVLSSQWSNDSFSSIAHPYSHTSLCVISHIRDRLAEKRYTVLPFAYQVLHRLHDLSPFCFRTPRSPLDQSKP